MNNTSNIIIIASPWVQLSPETLHAGPWKVEGQASAQLYCVEADDMNKISLENAKLRIKEIIEHVALPANFLFFGHHWRQEALEGIAALSQAGRKIRAFAFQNGRNYIYYNPETNQGLVGVYRLGDTGNSTDANDVVASYTNHTIRETSFNNVWNYYYYNFDREACAT